MLVDASNAHLTARTDDRDTSDDPIGVDGSVVRCLRCRSDVPHADQCAKCGAFLPSNSAALTHGMRRYQANGALPDDLRVDVDQFRAQLVADQGGVDELSAVRAGLCRMLVDAEVGRRLLMQQVVKHGIDSKPGRAAYDRLLATMDRWQRVAVAIGVERKQRPVTFAQAVVHASRTTDE